MHKSSFTVATKERGLDAPRKAHTTTYETIGEFHARLTGNEVLPALKEKPWSSWRGNGLSLSQALTTIKSGDDSIVPDSDKLLDKLEALLPDHMSLAWRTVQSMAGGFPDVPAMLAGQPMAMRLRKRMESQQAPLTLLVDLTSSGGISEKHMRKRGVALLALVRILSAKRPVSIYATIAPGNGNRPDADVVYIRLDTAPLDLARAAHLLSHQSVSRGVGYALCGIEAYGKAYGSSSWPFGGNHALYRKHAANIFKQAQGTSPHDEVLYIPAPHTGDKETLLLGDAPEQWLIEMLHKHGGTSPDNDS